MLRFQVGPGYRRVKELSAEKWVGERGGEERAGPPRAAKWCLALFLLPEGGALATRMEMLTSSQTRQ